MTIRLLCFTAFLVAGLGIITSAFSGCSSFSTSSPLPCDDGAALTGIPYYLPMGRIHIVGGTPASTAKPAANVSDDSASNTNAAGADTNAAAATPPGGGDASGDKTSGAGQYVVTITAVFGPDPSRLYYVKRNSNYLDDDKISLTVNSSHLLSSSSATSTDETANIIAEAAQMVVAVRDVKKGVLKPFDVTFDPTPGGDELTQAIALVGAAGLVLDTPTQYTNASHELFKKENGAVGTTGEGIAFRLPCVWKVTVKSPETANPKILAVQDVVLPDKNCDYLLDTTRMPLVTKTTNIGFTNGMLTSFSQSVPSPILGILNIPKQIISAILPIPSNTPVSGTTGTTAKKS